MTNTNELHANNPRLQIEIDYKSFEASLGPHCVFVPKLDILCHILIGHCPVLGAFLARKFTVVYRCKYIVEAPDSQRKCLMVVLICNAVHGGNLEIIYIQNDLHLVCLEFA